MKRKRFSFKLFFGIVVTFAVVAAGAFFGVQFFTKTGIFRVPGVVYYDESLSSDEIARLAEIFDDESVDLDKDVTISARYELELPELQSGEFLSEILVPVTDFYSVATNVDATVEELFDTSFADKNEFKLYNIKNLNYKVKLLKLNNKYYLDEFTTGGVYRIIKFESELYDKEIAPLVSGVFDENFPNKENVLTFAQTGVTALSRGMNAKLSSVGDAEYFAEQIGPFLSAFDITHTSNESSFTNYANSSNICSNPKFITTLTAIGLDVVELTGNHNQDCGDEAALETLDIYDEHDIKTVGGGRTATEAAVPLEIDEKGTAITMLAFNESTGGATDDNTPGANQYDEETAAAQIQAAKARGDFVIVDIQYYECSNYDYTYENATCDYADSAAGDEIGLFRHLIDLGADVVVGTAAHQAQTYELYGDGVIYYGLGNLFFDQVWWPGTTRSLILAHYFYNGELLQTKLVGTVYDNNMQTRLMDEETLAWWLGRLTSARP